MKLEPKVKIAFEKIAEGLRGVKDSNMALATIKVDARVIENELSEGRARNYTYFADEPEERGGTGKGPTPLEYFISGFAFCMLTIHSRIAALLELKIDSLEISVRARFDRRGLYLDGGFDPAFKEVIYELRVNSPEPERKIIEWTKMAEKRCPAYRTMFKATKVSGKLLLNGKPLDI